MRYCKYAEVRLAFLIFCKRWTTKNLAAFYICKLPMNKTDKKKHKYIPEKFKSIESFTFTTNNDELMVVFHGFEQEMDMHHFAEFMFGKLGMHFNKFNGPPTLH